MFNLILSRILFKPVHKIFNFIFRKTDKKKVDDKYFFSNEYGTELITVGSLFTIIGLSLYYLKKYLEVLESFSIIFFALGVFLIFRSFGKFFVFDKKESKNNNKEGIIIPYKTVFKIIGISWIILLIIIYIYTKFFLN